MRITIGLLISLLSCGVIFAPSMHKGFAQAASPPTRPSTGPTGAVVVFGTLTLADGVTPAANVTIMLEDAAGEPVSVTLTSSSGAFVFPESVGPGSYQVIVMDAEREVLAKPIRIEEGAGPIVIHLRASGPIAVKAEAPASRPATRAATAVVVFGTVTLPDGVTPLADVSVYLQDSRGRIPEEAGKISKTDEHGAFSFGDKVTQGTYVIAVSENTQVVARQPLIVEKTGEPHVLVHLRAASGSLNGRLLDTDGNPIRDASIRLLNDSQRLVYRAEADENGFYSIRHILPGQYIAGAFVLRESANGKINGASCMDVVVIESKPLQKDFTLRPFRGASRPSQDGMN